MSPTPTTAPATHMTRDEMNDLQVGDSVEVMRDDVWVPGLVVGHAPRWREWRHPTPDPPPMPVIRHRRPRGRRDWELPWDDPQSIRRLPRACEVKS